MNVESERGTKKISYTLIQITIVLFLLHMIASKLYWYNDFWWFDMLMHFLGGVFISMLTWYLIFRTRSAQKVSFSKKIQITLISVLVIGFFWEIYEYIVQGFTGAILANPLDSLSDLFFDMAGGFYCAHMFQKQHGTIYPWNKKN